MLMLIIMLLVVSSLFRRPYLGGWGWHRPFMPWMGGFRRPPMGGPRGYGRGMGGPHMGGPGMGGPHGGPHGRF